MEAILAIIRPKQIVVGQEFKAKFYDILLLDHKNDRHGKTAKYLPTFPLQSDKEPRDEILSHVFTLTGGDHGGIKGERALVIPFAAKDLKDSFSSHSSSKNLSNFILYCIPVSMRDKLSTYVDKTQSSPGFYSLDNILNSLHSSAMNFSSLTKNFVSTIEQWLKEKHSKSDTLGLVFRSRADYRVKMNVSNPVFLPITMGLTSSGSQSSLRSDYPDEIRIHANESLAKMMEIEKCAKVLINPLFGSGLVATGRRTQIVDPPIDYLISGTVSRKSSLTSSADPDHYTVEDREHYPLHYYAARGDYTKVQDFLGSCSISQRDRFGWAPIHIAAWYGHHDIVQLLLMAGSSPNITNADERTPLHLAARAANLKVVHTLLNHPEIDTNVVDKKGMTALDSCEQKLSWEHIKVAKIIEQAARQPKQIKVYLMDGGFKSLNLLDGANTTVQQLNTQMLREYNMPETPYADIFTIWICSQSLELQLKLEHKPLEQITTWTRKIVGNLTDGDPQKEEPTLKWRRNAKISLIVEREVTHPDAIRLLFHEAEYNYINAFYPCKEQDVWLFASILLFLKHGSQDQQAKAFLNRNLPQLVPVPNLKKNSNLSTRILSQYRDLCSGLTEGNTTRIRLQTQFLNSCRNLTVYGSAFFTGGLQSSKGSGKDNVKCYIAVNDVGIHIINYQSRLMLHSFKYSEILWEMPQDQYGILELNVTNLRGEVRQADRNLRKPLKLITKQAGMINQLMKKLSRMMYTIA